MYSKTLVILMIVNVIFLTTETGVTAEDYVLDTFGENIEEKDLSIQLSSNQYPGTGVHLRSWDIRCTRWPEYDEYGNFLRYDYYLGALVEDYDHEYFHVDLIWPDGTEPMAYEFYRPNEWNSIWSPQMIISSELPPVFPQYCLILMETLFGQTDIFYGTVNSFGDLDQEPVVDLTSPPYTGSFRVQEHDFGEQVILKSISINAGESWVVVGDMEIEIKLYGKETESSDWFQIGVYTFELGIEEITIDGDITVRKVKYGLLGTEGIKISAPISDPTPDLYSVTLRIKVSTVPNVLGMSETEAEAALIAADLVKGEVTLACDTIGFGLVMAQNPIAGTEVASGSEVDLVMGVLVPDVVGLTEADAEISLIDASLTKGASTYEFSDTVPACLVIGQSPIDGTIVQCASPVDLVISGALVPNLVGMTETEADIELIDADLIKGSVVEEHSGTVPAGEVISQKPDPDTIVACDSAVDLVISSGPDSGGCIIIEDDFNDGNINLKIWRNADNDPIGENYPYRYPIERNGRLEIVNNNTNDTDGLRTVINLPVDGHFQAQVSFDASECEEESALSFSVHNAATDYGHFVQYALIANALLTDGGRQWIVAKSAGTGDENLVIEASEPTSHSSGVFYMTYDTGVITFSHTGFGAVNAMHTVDISGWTDCTHVWLYLGAWSDGAVLTGAGSYFDDFFLSTCEPAHIEIVRDTISTITKTITLNIWPPEGYDVSQMNQSSIRLNADIKPTRISVRKHQQMLVVKFPTSELSLVPGLLELTVSGELIDGTTFEDSDYVTVVQKGGKSS